MTIAFDDHLRAEYESAIRNGLPSSMPIEDFAAAYAVGLRDGQIIKDHILQTAREQAEELGFLRGKAQGLAYAAYAASHVSTIDIHAAMKPADAASQMRENITTTLELARNLAVQKVPA